MDRIVPTPQRRLKCGISITPQEMVYVQQTAQAGGKASTACSLGLQLLGLERFVHFKKLSFLHSSFCCSHTKVSVEQTGDSHPSPPHGQRPRTDGRGCQEHPGLSKTIFVHHKYKCACWLLLRAKSSTRVLESCAQLFSATEP